MGRALNYGPRFGGSIVAAVPCGGTAKVNDPEAKADRRRVREWREAHPEEAHRETLWASAQGSAVRRLKQGRAPVSLAKVSIQNEEE